MLLFGRVADAHGAAQFEAIDPAAEGGKNALLVKEFTVTAAGPSVALEARGGANTPFLTAVEVFVLPEAPSSSSGAIGRAGLGAALNAD